MVLGFLRPSFASAIVSISKNNGCFMHRYLLIVFFFIISWTSTAYAEKISEFRGVQLGMPIEKINELESVLYGYFPRLTFEDDLKGSSGVLFCEEAFASMDEYNNPTIFGISEINNNFRMTKNGMLKCNGDFSSKTLILNNNFNPTFFQITFFDGKLIEIYFGFNFNEKNRIFTESLHNKYINSERIDYRNKTDKDNIKTYYSSNSYQSIYLEEHYQDDFSLLNVLKDNKLKVVYFLMQDSLASKKFEDEFLKLYQENLQASPSLQDIYNKEVEEFKLRQKRLSPNDKENNSKEDLDKKYLN